MREKQKTKILEHEAAFSSDGLSEFNFSPGFARAMVSDSVGGIGEYDELDAQLEKELIERPRCGDLFSLMSSDHVYKDGVEFQKAIPIFDVGLIMVNMDLDINSGLEYSQKTYNDCNGMNGEEGSECELICPSLDSGIPRGQYDADKDGASNKFQCMCSQDTLTNEYICYWRPLEKIWHREFTCNSTRQLSNGNKSRQRLKLTSWWKNSDSAEWRWDDAVNRYKEFLMDDDEHMDGEHHKRHNKNRYVFASRPGEFSDLFSEPLENDLFLGGFQKPHEKSNLQSQLLNDDDYSTIEMELNHLEQMQDPTFSEKISRQKYRKMKHMAEVIAYFQTDRSFSKFYEYGCHCWQDRSGMMLSGGGKPVDAIDKSCMQHKQCSKCAKIDFGGECHEYRGYSFEIGKNGTLPHFKCLDNPAHGSANACRHSLCECDKKFVERLDVFQDLFNTKVSQWSTIQEFDREFQCSSSCPLNTDGTCLKFDKCCGDYPLRKPYIDGSGQKCCAKKLVNLFQAGKYDSCD